MDRRRAGRPCRRPRARPNPSPGHRRTPADGHQPRFSAAPISRDLYIVTGSNGGPTESWVGFSGPGWMFPACLFRHAASRSDRGRSSRARTGAHRITYGATPNGSGRGARALIHIHRGAPRPALPVSWSSLWSVSSLPKLWTLLCELAKSTPSAMIANVPFSVTPIRPSPSCTRG